MSGRAYSAPGYAASLFEFGSPRRLPRSGGWLLEREIAGGAGHDLMGPYPLFGCIDWEGLPEDMDGLDEAVSVVLVADPLADVGEPELRRAFPDRVVPFKRHHVRDLEAPRASPSTIAAMCGAPRGRSRSRSAPTPWSTSTTGRTLYAELAERHGLTGISAFSREAFRKQLALPAWSR